MEKFTIISFIILFMLLVLFIHKKYSEMKNDLKEIKKSNVEINEEVND